MSEPDWFMNLLIWWVYQLIQGIVLQYIGFWFALFSDWDWGRTVMLDIGTDLGESATMMANVQKGVEAGSWGA